jgi:gluconokinase
MAMARSGNRWPESATRSDSGVAGERSAFAPFHTSSSLFKYDSFLAVFSLDCRQGLAHLPRAVCADGGRLVIVVMGVAGAGKTTVGQLLAAELGWAFEDADDYHSAANVEKMRNGIPLTDEDRAPWLKVLRGLISGWLAEGKNAVLACSALKRVYRDRLRVAPEVHFVYLRATAAVLQERLRARHGHYMTEPMLASQLAALEEPEHAIVIEADGTPEEIVREILARLALTKKP